MGMIDYSRTERHRIKGMLRQMFLKSKERNACLKRDEYTCQICKRKKTTKKGKELNVEVHHKEGIDVWNDVIELIREQIICDIDKLQTLCIDCHLNIEKEGK